MGTAHCPVCWRCGWRRVCLQLAEQLGVPKGPMMGQLTAAVLDWMMAHPSGSKEDCLAAMKQQLAERQKSA